MLHGVFRNKKKVMKPEKSVPILVYPSPPHALWVLAGSVDAIAAAPRGKSPRNPLLVLQNRDMPELISVTCRRN